MTSEAMVVCYCILHKHNYGACAVSVKDDTVVVFSFPASDIVMMLEWRLLVHV